MNPEALTKSLDVVLFKKNQKVAEELATGLRYHLNSRKKSVLWELLNADATSLQCVTSTDKDMLLATLTKESLKSCILQCINICNRILGLLAESSDSVAEGEGISR
ncbi:hypothetical protein RYX36_004243 [Vicia faba]